MKSVACYQTHTDCNGPYCNHRKAFITFEVKPGFAVKARDGMDNRRWYFNSFMEAEEWANYLERSEPR